MIKPSFPYRIEEVSNVDSPHLAGMNHWLEKLFPEYAPPRFDTLLTNLQHGDGRHEIQIFVGLIDNQVVGLMQVFYREWQRGLIADIDLLGVLEPYRRLSLASSLVKQALLATHKMALQYELPAVGVASLLDPHYRPVIRLHEKLGGQVRTDYTYPSGDIIVWYPMLNGFAGVETQTLAQQFQQFGRLLKKGVGTIE
jgi:GNAT superfamily N-acetyltransferase